MTATPRRPPTHYEQAFAAAGGCPANLALAGHRLRPWPDMPEALHHLAGRFTIVALPHGKLSTLTDLFAAAGLTWHCVRRDSPRLQARPGVDRLAVDRLAWR